MKQLNIKKALLFTLPVLLLTLITFQNCGEGFEAPLSSNSALNLTDLNVLKAPVARTGYIDGSVTFTASALSTGVVTYQWWKGDVPLAGEIGPRLTLTGLTAEDAGFYWVRLNASRPDGDKDDNTLSTDPVELAVLDVPAENSSPIVLEHSQSQFAQEDNSLVLYVKASGYPVPTYQWYKDGEALLGEVNDFLILPTVALANEGIYHVQVSNSEAVVNTDPFYLKPGNLPVNPIVVESAAATLNLAAGQEINLYAKAVGLPALEYEWAKDGVVIQGANGPRYVIQEGVSSGADSGQYTLTISSVDNAVVLASEVLTFDVTVIDALQVLVAPVNVMVNAGQDATFSISVAGQVDAYQWFRVIDNDNDGNLDDVAIDGAILNTLTLTAVTSADAGIYKVRATNLAGSIEASALLTVVDPPTIVLDPQATIADYQQAANLSVIAAGLNLTYQWFFENVAIAGAVNNIYTIPVAEENHIGAYHVVVTNGAGSVTSNTAQVVVNLPLGVSLYSTNCAACHGAPASLSVKRNRSATQITDAIANVPAMQGIVLTAEEIQAIADSLAD